MSHSWINLFFFFKKLVEWVIHDSLSQLFCFLIESVFLNKSFKWMTHDSFRMSIALLKESVCLNNSIEHLRHSPPTHNLIAMKSAEEVKIPHHVQTQTSTNCENSSGLGINWRSGTNYCVNCLLQVTNAPVYLTTFWLLLIMNNKVFIILVQLPAYSSHLLNA